MKTLLALDANLYAERHSTGTAQQAEAKLFSCSDTRRIQ